MTDIAEACPGWYALRLRSNQEFRVSDLLQARGVETWHPTIQTETRWSDRKKTVTRPLFPGYLFVRFKSFQSALVVSTPGVVQILPTSLNPSEIPDSEIRSLKTALSSGLASRPCPYVTGNKVRLDKGPLAGIKGIVLRTKGSSRIVVSIDILHRSVSIEVDAADLKKAA